MSEPVRTSTLSPAGPDSSPAHAAPNPERTSPLIAVRDTLGNRGFGAFLQTQLTIGRPDDSYETEADQVADHVMRMPEPSGAPPAIRSLSADPGHRVRRQMEEEEEEEEEEDADDLGDSTGFDVQRKCAECEEEETAAGMVQRKYAECKQEEQAQGTIQRQMEEEEEEEEEEEAGTVQRQMEEGEEEEEETAVQTKRHPSTGPAAIAAGTASRVESLRGRGDPLNPSLRAYFEPRFGRDFGAVRTHTGADADATSRALGARAYTFGSHIAFRDGAYAPHSDEGRRLMAHELTHVAQQGSAPFGATVQRKPIPPFDGFTADESVIHSLSPDPVPPVRRQMEEEEPEEDLGDDSGVGIQRKCAHCDEEEKGEEMIQRQMEEDEEAEDEGDGTIQRQAEDDEFEDAESEEEEETAVQPKRQPSAEPLPIAAGTASRVESLRGHGDPLNPSLRAYFEPRFGRDFGSVRTHTGAAADATSRALGARAYTFESNIAFREGAYSPHSDDGRRLLAHELTHVAQQGSAPSGTAIQRKPNPSIDGFSCGLNRAPAVGSPIVDEVLSESGERLDSSTRAFMEPRFGSSFADVRVHTGGSAAESARAVDAEAYTVGRQIVFDTGRYAPATATGRALLAHELAHVVQQSRSPGDATGSLEAHADSAAAAVSAGQNTQVQGAARVGIQRKERTALSAVENTAVSLLLGPIGLVGTQSRIVSAAIAGMIVQMISELSGAQGVLFLSNLKSFRGKDIPKFLGGYYLGLVEGVLSPITDLFGLAVFGEQMQLMAQHLAATAIAKRAELADDLKNLFPSWAEVKAALGPLLAHIRAHPGGTLLGLLSIPDHLADQAEALAYEIGKKGGSHIVHALNEPWEKKPEAPAPKEPFWRAPLAAIQHGAESLESKLIETPWAKVGNKVGYAAGFAIITIVLFAFTDGIGNLIAELGNALGKLSKSLGFLARGAEKIAGVLKTVGLAVAEVEKLIGIGLGKLLKPLEAILEPILAPLTKFLGRLRIFLRKLFGVVEKESAAAATAVTAKAADVVGDEAAKFAPKPPAQPVKPTTIPKEPVPHVPTNADVRKVVPGITDETATMLSKKPDLLDALKKNPRAAEALKLCKSHCIPEFAEPSQVARLEKFFENGKSQGIELDQARLKEYLHKSKDTADLTKRLDKLEQAMTDAQPTGTIALKDAIMDQAELAADVGTYTTKIKWGIQEIEARPHGPGYWGKRTPQGNARVDAYELKINPNGESYYLPHPDGGFVQFEGLATGALKDGKLIMSPKSLYHVEDMPSFAKDKVLAEARRQMAAAKGPGLRVEWLVSDTKAETQLRTLFTTEGITIDITFLAE